MGEMIMRKAVQAYFADLHSTQLNIQDNIIQQDEQFSKKADTYTSNVKVTTLNGVRYYLKDFSNGKSSIQSIATSKMYNDVGISTPELYLFKPIKGKVTLLSQDVMSLDRLFDITIAMDCPDVRSRRHKFGERFHNYYKWQVLIDPQAQSLLREYMTEDCCNQLINLFLADELRTDSDRHHGNYFLYKTPNAKKFEGIIPIDFDLVQILNHKIKSQDDFMRFIKDKMYCSFTPTSITDNYATYYTRMEDLRDLLDAGDLKEPQIEFLRKVISYDFPKTIIETTTNPTLMPHVNGAYDAYSRLWGYNFGTLGRDLGM